MQLASKRKRKDTLATVSQGLGRMWNKVAEKEERAASLETGIMREASRTPPKTKGNLETDEGPIPRNLNKVTMDPWTCPECLLDADIKTYAKIC